MVPFKCIKYYNLEYFISSSNKLFITNEDYFNWNKFRLLFFLALITTIV